MQQTKRCAEDMHPLGPDSGAWAIILGTREQQHNQEIEEIFAVLADMRRVMVQSVMLQDPGMISDFPCPGLTTRTYPLYKMMNAGWVSGQDIQVDTDACFAHALSRGWRDDGSRTWQNMIDWAHMLTDLCECFEMLHRKCQPPPRIAAEWDRRLQWTVDCLERGLVSRQDRRRAGAAIVIQKAWRTRHL